MAFDVNGALKEGYSHREIADYLAQNSKFNVAGARQEGYSDQEIIQHLSPMPEPAPTGVGTNFVRGAKAGWLGANKAVGDVLRYGGEMLESDTLSDIGKTTSEYWGEKVDKNAPRVQNFTDIDWTKPSDFADWASWNIGQMGAQVAVTAPFMLMGGTSTIGLKGISSLRPALAEVAGSAIKEPIVGGFKATKELLTKGNVSQFGKFLGNWAKLKPMDIPIGILEAGQIAEGQLSRMDQGESKEEALDPIRGLAATFVATKLEELGAENMVNRLFKTGTTGAAGSLFRRIGKTALATGVGEGTEEFFQTYAEQAGIDPKDLATKEMFIQAVNGAAAGFAGGFAMGAGGGAVAKDADQQKTKYYNQVADGLQLKEDIANWQKEGLPAEAISERINTRISDTRTTIAAMNKDMDQEQQLPLPPDNINVEEMIEFLSEKPPKPPPGGAGSGERIRKFFGLQPRRPAAETAPVEPEAGMTVNSVETTDLGQAQQNQMRQAEDQKKAARAQGEGLFDKVLTDLTAEGQQQIEAARLAEDQAREEEQARLAEAEAQKVAAAVAAADQQQAQVKSALAADDSRKQAIVDEVMGLSDKRLFTAAQAEAGWNIVPDGRGSYALETPQGNVPVNLMQIREQLAARRIADYDAKMAKQQADEEATQRMEAEAAERRARKLEKKRIEYLRKSLQGMSLTQGQVDSLEQMRDQLTPDEIRRLDLHKRDLAQKEAAKAFEAKAPAAPIQPEAVLEEKPNPEKATTEQDAAAQETALIDAMLIELDGAARGGLLLEDETTGEKTRTGTGIGWLSAANQKGWGIGTADARTILEKAREGKPLTERQQNIYNDLTRQAQQSAPGDLAEELLWVGKGFQPLRAGKVSVDEMTAGDAFVIGGEEYKVSDIDEDGNVTLKDGTIKKVKAGTELSGVDYVKIDQEAVSFDPDQLTDEEQQPAALAPKSGTMEDKGPAEIVESAATSQAEKTGETAKNPVTQGARSLGARPEVEIESKRQARIDYDRSESKRNIKLLIKKIKELPYKKRASVVAGDYYDSVKNFVNDLRKEGGVDEDTISVLVNSGLYDDAYLKEIIPEHQPPAKQQGAKSLGVRPAAAPAETSGRQMYRGSGRENEAAVYNDLTDQKALLGDGQFWALSEKDAKTYGPNVESKPIPEFSKPLIVKDDYAWQSLIKKAVGKYDSADERISYPNPFGLPKEQMDLWRKGVSDYLRENGHDALIINMDGARGDDAKTLYNAFGHSQIFIPAAQAAQAPAQLSKPPEDSISGKVEAAGASPEVTVPQGARSLGAKPALQSAAPAETSKEGVFTNHGNPYNLAFEPGKSYDITYRSDGGQVRKFKGYIFKEDEDYGKAQNWKFTHPTKGNLESFSKSSIIAAGENQQSTQGAKSLGARPKGAKTHAWEIKKQFEEDNRKTFESLSYVGDLIKREELQGDWIRLTYADKPTRNAVTVDVIESMGSAANRFENGDVVSYKNKLWSVAGRHVNRITIQEQGNKDQMLIVDPRHLTLLPKASLKPATAEAAAAKNAPRGAFPAPEKTVRADSAAKESGERLTQRQADQRLQEWKKETERVKNEEDHSKEVILSLFDRTGIWSRPYAEAGYNVITYDAATGEDIFRDNPLAIVETLENQGWNVTGILSAPPCTSFSASGARWWENQHDIDNPDKVEELYGKAAAQLYDKPIDAAEALAGITGVIVDIARERGHDLQFYALENPVGRIADRAELPDPALTFHPNNYGDPYTKKTMLWGEFNPDLPRANVEPHEGSRIHALRGNVPEQKSKRSETPEGFAYAFFMANHAKPTGAGLKQAPAEAAVPAAEQVKGEDLSTKSTSELVGDIFSIINDHIGKRGSVPVVSGKEIVVDDSLYQKLKPYLAEIVNRAKTKALDAKAYLYGAVDSMPEGKAKTVYEASADRYLGEDAAAPAEKKPAEKTKLTYEQFAKQYQDAFANTMKYTTDQVGSRVYSDQMAELADEYPEFLERFETAEEAKAAPKSPDQEEIRQRGVAYDAGLSGKRFPIEYEQTPILRAAYDAGLSGKMFPGTEEEREIRRQLVTEAPAKKTSANLSAYGLTVTKGTTNTGKTVWNISGKETRTWKDTIKKAGGRWYGPKKVWSFYNGDPTSALLAALPPIEQIHPNVRHDAQPPPAPTSRGQKELDSDLRRNDEQTIKLTDDEIIDQYLEGKQTAADRGLPQMMILTGGPAASGKSTGKPKTAMEHMVVVNSDRIGELLGAGIKTPGLHERSSEIAKKLLDRALADGYDIMYDSQLTNFELADNAITDVLKNGGSALVAFSNIDAETSIVRTGVRYQAYKEGLPGSENRYVPEEASIKGYNRALPTFLALFNKYKGNPNVDFKLTDNNVDFRPLVNVFDQTAGKLTIDDQELFDNLTNIDYIKIEAKDGVRYERKERTLQADLGREAIQARRDALLVRKRASQSGSPVATSRLETAGEKQKVKGADHGIHDESATKTKDDRAGTEGSGAADVSGIETSQGATAVPGGTRRVDDGRVRSDLHGTDAQSVTGSSERLPAPSSGLNIRTEPGVGRSNGDMARIQRSGTDAGRDHVITPGAINRSGSWIHTASQNLDIIELAKKLTQENRQATPEEQELLARYTGFGASDIANHMFPGWAEEGKIQMWRVDSKWKPLVERMTKLLTPAEIAAAARSTQYAHYTSAPIISSIYRAMEKFGFTGGRVLEPGMGVGSFFGLMPQVMRAASKYTGIEMDAITAQIAKHLYPNQNLIEGDYTKQRFPNGFFDLGVGNPPFSSIKILSDPDYKKLRLSLHDFFFVKTMDKIRPGGLMVFITSRYTMDKQDDRVRKMLNQQADLLGAIRLPQTAFKHNAGTEVVTDVLFLRKKVPGEQSQGQLWDNVSPVNTPEGEFLVNEYFVAHPEMVLGQHSGKGKMYGPGAQYTVLPSEGDIEAAFDAAVTQLPSNVYSMVHAAPAAHEAAAIEKDFNPLNKKEGGLYLSEKGVVMVTESGAGVPVTSMAPRLTPKDLRWLSSYIDLRNAVKQCQYDQLHERDWEKSLQELNRVYATFKLGFGRILDFTLNERKDTDEDGNKITVAIRKLKNIHLLKLDVEYPLVSSLEQITEDGKIVNGPFLEGRTIKKPVAPEIKSAPDALAVSLNERGKLDLAHIASLLGQSDADVIEQLGDLIYETPDKGFVTADEYLSGDVVTKLADARAAAKLDPKYNRNVDALAKSQPTPLSSKDVTVSPGSSWVPVKYYNSFIHTVLELPTSARVNHSTADNQWSIEGLPKQSQRGRASEWSTPDRGANEIFMAVLNNATIRVYRTQRINGQDVTSIDPQATAQVNDVAKRLRARFKTWVWEDANRAREILDIYNATRNNIVPRRFDGRHLTLPGVSLRYTLLQHQKEAIWRIIQDGNTYIAHAVGAGKTYEMVAAGMEMKRLGLISKPLYVVPNHMLQQFSNEFQDLYPMAHIMVADDENFHTSNRRRFMAQAALNNPDAIVITHSAFGLLKMKEENIVPVRDEIIDELRLSLDDLKDDKHANRIRIKQMEKRIEQTEQRFAAMIAQGDNVLTFEDMGVDFLFVDEAHQFRKLDFTTNRQAKGIDPIGSVRAMGLYIKTKWLGSQRPGRSHVFASGTPITNTMGELYTIMKYFSQEQMARDGIDFFDSWATEYGEMASVPEMNAAGRYEIVDRFAKFVNVPELMSRARMFMDVLTSSQLGGFVQRPKIQGGQPTIVVTPASAALKTYQDEVLQPRIETSRHWKPSPQQPGNPDPLINIITDGRLASIDIRFVQPNAPNDPGSKLNQYIDTIIRLHQETKDNVYLDPATGKESPVKGAAQVCFFNHGFGRQIAANRGFDARAWAMSRFKEAGIPTSEIAWIEDYDTAAKKEAVMKELRTGTKRILLGSAKKMGTGMNVQTRLANMTYLDPPWYPSDVEQPLGRIIRQGNQNKEVGVYYFSTRGSYDATMWQMVTRKAKFIEDALAGGTMRSMEDISEASLYEMAAALASGDERAIRLAGLNADINNLDNLRSAHFAGQRSLAQEKDQLERLLPGQTSRVEYLTDAAEKSPAHIRYAPLEAKIGARAFNDKKDFGPALRDRIVALRTEGKEGRTSIGTFFGMDLVVAQAQQGDTLVHQGGFTQSVAGKLINQLQLRLTDKITYEVATDITEASDVPGLVTRLMNRAQSVHSDLSEAEQQLESMNKELKKINSRLGAPFELEQELHEKTAEAAQLTRELEAESRATANHGIRQTDKEPWELTIKEIKDMVLGEHGDSNEWGKISTILIGGMPLRPEYESIIRKAQLEGKQIPKKVFDENPHLAPTPGTPMPAITEDSAEKTKRLDAAGIKQMVMDLSGLLKGTSVTEKNGKIFLKTKSGEEVQIDSVESIDQNLIQVNAHYDPATVAGKRIRGYFAQEDGTFSITLSRSAANAWTLSHEFYHFLEAIGAISNADKLILNRKISALMAKNADEYKHLTGRSAPEQRAEYIGRALMGMYDAKSPSGKILARIREVIDQIVNALGVRTARGVIRDIEAGKIYEGQAIGNGLEAIGGKDNKYSITNHWWEGRDWQKEIDNLPLTYIQGPRPNIEKQGYIPITRAEADYFEKNGIDGITAFVELKGMETTGEEGWFIKPPVKWAEARRYKDGKIVKRFPADVEVFYYAAKKRYQDSLVSRNAGKSGTQQAGRRGATLRQFSIAEDDTTSSTQTQKTPLTLGQKAENVFAKRVAEPLGRKAAQGAASLGARVSGDTRATIQKLAKHFNEFWKPFSTVPDGDKILAKRYQAMGNVARAVRFIEDMNQKMSAWPDEVKRDVFWYLNGDIPIESIPEEARDLAKMIQRRTEVIGEMLVDRGILAEGQFAKYQGKYVHYLYAKHVLGDDAPIFLTSTGKLNLTYTKSRNTNMTLQQRKELGLIEDASVAVPVGMGKALTDIAKFDYLESIADNPDWVWQPSMINVPMGSPLKTPIKGRTRRFVKMGIGKLVEEVKIYDKMAAAHPSPEVSEIRDILRDALTKAEQASENMPDDFVQLPTSKGYGALAGAYVRKPIADDLMPVLDVATDRGKLMNTLLSIERQGMAGFKMGKVALNFPTAFRNVISNIIQNNMRGRPLSKIPGDIIRACESLKAKDQYYEEAFGMGLFHTNWFVSEINDVLEAFRGIVPQKGWKELGRDVVANATLTKPVTFDRIVTALTKLAKYYGKIDDINKLAIFIEQREAGKSADEAALTAMKWGMDYSLTSRSIKGLRQTIVPFATYQYKIAPLIAESLKTRPWVLAKFALLYPAAKMLAMALHDLDDDDWDDLEKQLPAYIKKSGSMLILPWKSDKDQWQWVNLEYFFPWGNALAIFRDARQMDSGEALRDLGISNPFLSMFYSGLSAREDQPPLHAYFGTPIYNDLDPGWMKAAKYLEYMANTWAPSMLTRQGAIGYTGKAIMGDEDRWGRSVSLPQAAGRWFGLNIVSVSPEQSRAQVSVKIQELHKELSRIEANPSYSEEEKEAYRSRMNERLADLAEESPSSVLPILKAKGQDPVYDALKEMAKQGILHTAPPSRSVEIGGIPYKMTMDQYRVYLQKSSDIARPKLQALVLSPGWATMSGKRKAQAVSAIVSHARKGVRQRIKAEIARERRSQAQSQ